MITGGINSQSINVQNPEGIGMYYYYAEKGSKDSAKILISPKKSDSADPNKEWSYMFKYNYDSALSVSEVTSGFSYGTYPNGMVTFVPPKDHPFDSLAFTIKPQQLVNSGDGSKSYFKPSSVLILKSRTPSGNVAAVNLVEGVDYVVIENKDLLDEGGLNQLITANQVGSTNSTAAAPTGAAGTAGTAGTAGNLSTPATTNPNGPGVKYIPGNPDYDKSMNPLGMQLTGPKTGLYVYSAISAIGPSLRTFTLI
ncbi:hypothetical protein AX774_g2247 [Zancudomyces culisetae]|uniref:Uncharacterized protein n=1 Tax=Zancudomyces culisetae TaxID=1213189 RepID=A0A1R1PTD6_ZANCU|nr:hypothetical protein AX774_g2247 [Zancudomyces culisetae]|eukprot:OMH84228.1 hypothetical protein AX774_g2247 [Zancudomyces culisetae]